MRRPVRANWKKDLEEAQRREQQHIVEHGHGIVEAKLRRADPRLRAERAREYEDAIERKRAYERTLPKPKPPTRVVETGAGEGRFSAHFRKKFGSQYVATDIADGEGDTGFLSMARTDGVATQFGVDANTVGDRVPAKSLDHVVGANPYGVRNVPGASYGLMREKATAGGTKWVPDDRFLKSAKPALRRGGTVELYGRSNVLRSAKKAAMPPAPQGRIKNEQDREAHQAATQARKEASERVNERYPGTNANPYLAIKPAQLHALAKSTGFKVRVKRAKQPPVRPGGDPDTSTGDRGQHALKPFTTRLSFTPADDGYISDDENPRVDYDSGDESDWER